MKSPDRVRLAVIAAAMTLVLAPLAVNAQGVPTDSGGYRLTATGTSGTTVTNTSTTTALPALGGVSFSLPRLGNGWFQFRWMLSPARPNTSLSAHALRERRASR